MDEDSFKRSFFSHIPVWFTAASMLVSLFLFVLPASKSMGQPLEIESPLPTHLSSAGVKYFCTERVFDAITYQGERWVFSIPPQGIPSLLKERKIRKRSIHRKSKELMYHPIILRAAKRHGVDPALIKAIIKAESGYNPKAISSKGARGLMQLMPNTAQALGVENTLDPEHNVNGGVKYFRDLLDQFDDNVILAIAAYNAGTWMVKKHKDVPPIPATQVYVKKVMEYYEYYKKEIEG